jgi:hypothetical protein
LNLIQGIETINLADLSHGTPFGIPFTFSFWFRSNIPNGSLVPVGFQYYVTTYLSYVTQFTVTNSGGWQYVSFTVPPPPTIQGVVYPTGGALYVGIASVSINPTSTVNAWQSGASFNSWSGNWMYPWYSQAGNYIELTGVQLEKGTVATPFEFRNYAQELALCQRYMFQLSPQDTAPSYLRTGAYGLFVVRFPVTMRTGVNPTLFGTFNSSIGSVDITVSSLVTPGGGYAPSATGSQYNFPSTQSTIGYAGNITINASSYIRYDAEL